MTCYNKNNSLQTNLRREKLFEMKTFKTAFKDTYEKGLMKYGFKKIKGSRPYYARCINNEIVHVISFQNKFTYKQNVPGIFNKAFTVLFGVATVYREKIAFDEQPKDNTEWLSELSTICYKEKMKMDFAQILGIDKLGLSYPVRVEGFDGECFTYSIYLDGDLQAVADEIDSAIDSLVSENEEKDIYLGYVDVSVQEDKIFIYHDLGNCEPENENFAIHEILRTIEKMKGIQEVVING